MELTIANLIMTFVLIGVAVFAVLTLVMIVLFGVASRPPKTMISSFVILFLISFSIPLTVGVARYPGILTPQAAPTIKITSFEETPIDASSSLVVLHTSVPAIVYLQYTDEETPIPAPLLPTHTLEKRSKHIFVIRNMSHKGGTVTVIIDGSLYDTPFTVRPNR